MLSVLPSVSEDVANLAPGFRALSIVVEATQITNRDIGSKALAQACKSVQSGDVGWAEAQLTAWANSALSHNVLHALPRPCVSVYYATAT